MKDLPWPLVEILAECFSLAGLATCCLMTTLLSKPDPCAFFGLRFWLLGETAENPRFQDIRGIWGHPKFCALMPPISLNFLEPTSGEFFIHQILLFQDGAGTQAELETGNVGTVFQEQKNKLEASEPLLENQDWNRTSQRKTVLKHKQPFRALPRGSPRTKNRNRWNRTELNRCHPDMWSMWHRSENTILTGHR